MKRYCVRLVSRELVKVYENYKGVSFDYDDCMKSINVNRYDAVNEIVEAETIEEAKRNALSNTSKYVLNTRFIVAKVEEI